MYTREYTTGVFCITFGHGRYGEEIGESGARAVAHEGQPIGITAEGAQIFPQPVYTRHQVHQPVVALSAAFGAGLQETCINQSIKLKLIIDIEN